MICIEDTEDAFITRVIAVPVLAVEAAADLADLAALERAVLLVLLQGVFHLRRVDLPTARFGAFDRPEDALLELGDVLHLFVVPLLRVGDAPRLGHVARLDLLVCPLRPHQRDDLGRVRLRRDEQDASVGLGRHEAVHEGRRVLGPLVRAVDQELERLGVVEQVADEHHAATARAIGLQRVQHRRRLESVWRCRRAPRARVVSEIGTGAGPAATTTSATVSSSAASSVCVDRSSTAAAGMPQAETSSVS